MGLWGLFTKSDKAVDAGLDLVKRGADGIDALFYTEEEKAHSAAERAQLKLKYAELNHEFVKSTLGESAVQTVTRRIMAWGIMGLGVLLTLYSMAFYTIGTIWAKEACIKVADKALEWFKVWWPIILAVAAFYFGVHMIRGITKKGE